MNIFKKFKLWTNGIQQYFFKGNITIGKKVKFYQKLRLYGSGNIIIGDKSSFGWQTGGRYHNGAVELFAFDKGVIYIGKDVHTNNNFVCSARSKIIIEDNVLIGEHVNISDTNGHNVDPRKRRLGSGTAREITIERNVWIGSNVTILPGTCIGKNSIVGAGSVVQGIFPSDVIIKGNPAIVCKKIDVKN